MKHVKEILRLTYYRTYLQVETHLEFDIPPVKKKPKTTKLIISSKNIKIIEKSQNKIITIITTPNLQNPLELLIRCDLAIIEVI